MYTSHEPANPHLTEQNTIEKFRTDQTKPDQNRIIDYTPSLFPFRIIKHHKYVIKSKCHFLRQMNDIYKCCRQHNDIVVNSHTHTHDEYTKHDLQHQFMAWKCSAQYMMIKRFQVSGRVHTHKLYHGDNTMCCSHEGADSHESCTFSTWSSHPRWISMTSSDWESRWLPQTERTKTLKWMKTRWRGCELMKQS